MGNTTFLMSIFFLIMINSFPKTSYSISSCNGWCQTENDCDGQLICINGKCNDDPDIGTHICAGGNNPTTPSNNGDCNPYGNLFCDGNSYPQYSCSPPVTWSTQAKLTLNDFRAGGDGGAQSECDGNFHDNNELIVALSTGWYAGGSRCFQMIRINANGRSVLAKVIDECDSRNGCDSDHAGQPPCRNNIVDGSAAVWDALIMLRNTYLLLTPGIKGLKLVRLFGLEPS